MTNPPRILVVDDEASIRKLVTAYLETEGWDVLTAVDGVEAVESVRRHHPDLVVLDVLMPKLDGVEALRQIRTFSDTYVIMLTARAEEADVLIGLAVGADDYLTKPFSPRELVARIKAVLRRARATGGDAPGEVLDRGALTISQPTRTVTVEGRPVELTTLEFDLLLALAERPGLVLSRRQLLERVWGWDHVGDERVVDVHIGNLRRALGDRADEPRWIGTVRGVGYRFVAPED